MLKVGAAPPCQSTKARPARFGRAFRAPRHRVLARDRIVWFEYLGAGDREADVAGNRRATRIRPARPAGRKSPRGSKAAAVDAVAAAEAKGGVVTPHGLTELQRLAGNAAAGALVGRKPARAAAAVRSQPPDDRVRRALPTEDEWKEESRIPGQRIDWRTREMKAIGTALRGYDEDADAPTKLAAIALILEAIRAWRLKKAADRGQDVSTIKDDVTAVPRGGAHEQSKRSAFVDSLLDRVKAEVQTLIAGAQAAWDPNTAFTDPAHHDPKNFTYMINGIQEYEQTPQHIEAVLENPTTIKNALISTSIITSGKTPLWCPSGFVLKAPKENVVSGSSKDQAVKSWVSMYHDVEIYGEIVRVFGEFGLPSPQQVLAGTEQAAPYLGGGYRQHNEVAVQGSTQAGGDVEVVGIFVVVAPGEADPKKPIMLAEKVLEEKIAVDGGLKSVVKMVPGVTEGRMKLYETTAAAMNVPIIAIPMVDSHFSKQGLFIWDDSTMIEEEEAQRRNLI